MKGQHLFVRPIEPADFEAIRTFLARHQVQAEPPLSGLVGKLVGDLVAVLRLEVGEQDVRIDQILVATELRRKRIGRAMVHEAERLAASLQRPQLVVDGDEIPAAFMQRVGFEREGLRWIRKVRK